MEPPPKGLSCSNCKGTWLKVVRTYRPSAGVVIRYRGCVDCGQRVKTRETVVYQKPPRPAAGILVRPQTCISD